MTIVAVNISSVPHGIYGATVATNNVGELLCFLSYFMSYLVFSLPFRLRGGMVCYMKKKKCF